MMRRASFLPLLLAVTFAVVRCDQGPTDSGAEEQEDFNPRANTEIQGNVNYSSVNIPVGVRVTATSDLVMNVSGSVNIAGALVGDCVEITVNGGSILTVSGSVSNACSGDGTARDVPPALVLVGDGDLLIDGATISSSGGTKIQNDPNLSSADFGFGSASPALASGPALERAGGAAARTCTYANFISQNQNPPTFIDGQDGQHGTLGATPGPQELLCQGDADWEGNLILSAGTGGRGGMGRDSSATRAEATGGFGGDGQDIFIGATGDLRFTNNPFAAGFPQNRLFSGAGGAGGEADATGLANPALAKAATAEAIGGKGGNGGRLEIIALGRIVVEAGALEIEMREGGRGGDGTARGAKGRDADGQPAGDGGDALATGGDGGGSRNAVIQARAGFTNRDFVIVGGGGGGKGGSATSVGGMGGAGNSNRPNGGLGGDMVAVGGGGGNADTRDASGKLIAAGGDGGTASFFNGTGGDGWPDCQAGNVRPGGEGGSGGSVAGGDGTGGTGLTIGQFGGVSIQGAGNGGNGGDGEPPGSGGIPGTDLITVLGDRSEAGSFKAGKNGDPCPVEVVLSGTYDVIITVLDDPAGHDPFINLGEVNQLTVEVSGSTITVSGPAPWVEVSGTLESDGFFVTIGRGTVAGFSDIDVTLVGFLVSPGVLAADYSMGDEGGLPGALPIIYAVDGEKINGL